MRKGLIGTFFLTLLALLIFAPEKAKAGHDIGIISKDNPCVYARFSMKEGDEYYCFFKASGKASKIKVSLECIGKGDTSLDADIADITDGYTVVKSLSLKNGKQNVTDTLSDFKDGDMFFFEIKAPSGSKKTDFGLCIYSEGLGGVKHDFSKVVLSKDEVTLKKGKSVKLKATLAKAIKKGGVTWKSSDKKVVTVSKKGKVTAKGNGYAVITCTSKKDKTCSAQCAVIVEDSSSDDKNDSSDNKDENTDNSKTGDDALLDKAALVLARTGQPLYMKLQGQNPSSQTDSSGKQKWGVSTNLNGTINYIMGFGPDNTSFITYTIRNFPCVSVGGSGSSGTRDELRNGSYDFSNDPSGVIIGWSMWTKNTTKEEMEIMLNEKISDAVYEKLIEYSKSQEAVYTGWSAVIVYGRNADGVLVGKYAGSANYNAASNAAVYNFIGVSSENEENYGKIVSGSALY